jgi:tetratricopeptide (TPR) repeat protein
MAAPDRCPSCGAELPPNAPEGRCRRCVMHQPITGKASFIADADLSIGLAATSPDHSTEPSEADSEATVAHIPGAIAALTSNTIGTLVDRSLVADGPTLTGDGHGAGHSLPRGTNVRYFGDYELQRELGRGGMGVVYKALQVSLNRPVALKMIKAGVLADEAELQRFQNEAEAVALLDHPGIVPVYEVGEHDGQRYFSMKLVEGGSLADVLPSFKDNPRAAAILLAETAEAIHHAHMRGILHRDLKPANILIDAEGRPHVTDFGLAKRVEGDVEMTQSGAILGTPAYMSPEQAAGRRGSITTATDVYGLGAILYASLTRKAPFGGSSVIETLDAVRTRPPEPPRKFNVHVPRDLETICLKCLEKDPRRRYASAHELAVDLTNWLDSRPINARRVGSAERAWLWCKRKPAVAVLAAAVLLAVVAGTAAVIAVQAKANGALATKNRALIVSLAREAEANKRVEQRYNLAMDAIKTFHTGVSEDFLLKEPQFRNLRDQLLNAAGDFYDKLNDVLESSADAASRRALFDSNFALAELTEKVGRRELALALHQSVLAGREALARESGADYRSKLEAGASMRSVISLLKQTKPTEVWPLLSRAVAFHEELAAAHPDDPEVQNGLAKVLILLGDHRKNIDRKLDEAERVFRRALAIWKALEKSHPEEPEHRTLQGTSLIYLSYLRADEGKRDETIKLYQQALDLAQERVDKEPNNVRLRANFAEKQAQMGHWYYLVDRTDRALDFAKAALASWQRIVADQPAVSSHQRSLAGAHVTLGMVLLETGKSVEAESELRAALSIRQALVDVNPDNANREGLAEVHRSLGMVLGRSGNPVAAAAEMRAAIAYRQAIADANPTLHSSRATLAENHMFLAGLLTTTPRASETEAEYQLATSLYEKLAGEPGADVGSRERLAQVHNYFGYWLSHGTNRLREAEGEHRAALAIAQEMVDKNPTVADYRFLLSLTLESLGNVLRLSDRLDEAEAGSRASAAILTKLAAESPDVRRFSNQLTYAIDDLSHVLRSRGRAAEARDGYNRALQVLKDSLGSETRKPVPSDLRGYTLRRRGLARLDLGDIAGAAEDTRRALAFCEGGSPQLANDWFEVACCHAALAGLAGRDGSGISLADANPEADAAMALLSRVIGMGHRSAALYRTESALDPLRRRKDFRLMMMDLAVPANPFMK